MIDALANIDFQAEASRYAIALLRTSGLVVFCPIFSSQLLPLRARSAIAAILACVMLPLVPEMAETVVGIGGWLLFGTRELFVGLGLGIVARAIFNGIEGAARLVAGQSGFALSSMVDPVTGAASVTPALFHSLLATSLMLAANLHHVFIKGLVYSFEVVPPAASLPALAGLRESAALAGTKLFSIAVVLAAPALVATFAVDLLLVLVGRAFPQIPVLMVGYPIKVAAGLVALVLLVSATGTAIHWIGKTIAADGATLLTAMGVS
jgi:flagellar biosynthetic protein FliR